MRRALPCAVAVIAFLGAWVVYTFAQEPAADAGRPAPAWEYRVVMLLDVVDAQRALQEPGKTGLAVESKFNELGRDGWEWCGDLPGAAVFKRPKR